MILPVPTWFVGCGNMGQAMVEGWRSAGVDLSSAVAILRTRSVWNAVVTSKSARSSAIGGAPSSISSRRTLSVMNPWSSANSLHNRCS